MVSIIILSYNTKKLLDTCLDALHQHKKTTPFEIIVVDNNSTDGSPTMLKKKYKDVVLIENKENTGFAKGVNIGAKKAKGELLFFLNSDTLVKEFALSDAVALFSNDPQIGIVGGALLEKDRTFQRSYGAFYNVFRVGKMLLFGVESSLSQKEIHQKEVDWVSGGCMIVRKDLFQKLKGLDEHFFMYIEDVELCYRIKQLGKKVVFFPDLAFFHIGHGSSNRTFAIVNIYKGLLYFFRKHRYYGEYILVRLLLFMKAIVLILIGVLTKNKYLLDTYKQAIRYTV